MRLVGYVLRTEADSQANRVVLDDFQSAVKQKEELFESFSIKIRDVHGGSNLTYFEVIITLKEALKK